MPYFSIILPTYNRAHFLPKAIESVLAQTFEDWELVIVDDGSTDNTKEVVLAYQDPRIVYFYQENQERSAARNNGMSKAKGDFICFLDSDDYYLPEKLNNYKDAIDANLNRLVVFYDGLMFEENGTFQKFDLPVRSEKNTLYEFLLLNPIGPLQMCIPSSLLKKQLFNPLLRIGEDVELWMRIIDKVDLIAIQSFETIALEHEDRSVNLKRFNAAKEQLKQLELIFGRYDHHQISQKVRSEVLSNCYFNSAKHFMMNNKKRKAITMIVKSISRDLGNSQIKHRFFCLSNLCLGKVPKEYKK